MIVQAEVGWECKACLAHVSLEWVSGMNGCSLYLHQKQGANRSAVNLKSVYKVSEQGKTK